SNQRNFKNSSNFKTLQHEIFETFCIDEACYQINESLQLEKISEQGSATKKAEGSANNFFFPISNAWIVATSLPTENLFTIKKLNVELQEQWQIIYEKSRLDTLVKMIQYSNVLGYNDHILIFNSNIDQIRKSGFIDLENGIK